MHKLLKLSKIYAAKYLMTCAHLSPYSTSNDKAKPHLSLNNSFVAKLVKLS